MSPETLYESPDLLAVDKPPGITVIPARGEDPSTCLHKVLEAQRGEKLWVVHRLDRDTSGVLVFARTATAHRELCQAFEGRLVRKTYLALTRGAPPLGQGVIDAPLHTARKGKMRPAKAREPGALEAVTEYTVLRRWDTPEGPVALVEARPRTGRQHQVRVHLRWIGAPLLVDPLYGDRQPVPGLDRLTLHALGIELPGLRLEAPLARDLSAYVDRLGGTSPGESQRSG